MVSYVTLLIIHLAVSAYLFFTTMAGTLSTALLGEYEDVFETAKYPARYGYIMCAFVLFSYLGSIPFFYLAGRSYEKFKRKQDEENDKKASPWP